MKECTQVRPEGCFLMTGGNNKSKNDNENSIFIVREGAEQQEISNGGAIG